jgi:4-hydroxybenzoyl-CoA thioesterase/acyl-CoA thioester hydrolase
MSTFTVTRRVAFSETDAAGLMHFSRYFVWMEDAEHALLRSIGESVHTTDDDGQRLFPRVAVQAEYASPLRFEDVVDVSVTVRKRSTRSITYGFRFQRQGDDAPCASGQFVAVCSRAVDGKVRAAPIPPSLAAALDALLETP